MAPIGRPVGSFRQQYEQRQQKRQRIGKVTSARSRIQRNEVQIPTPSSSITGDVSEPAFITTTDIQDEVLTPLSVPVNNTTIANDDLSRRVQLPSDGHQIMGDMPQSILGSTTESTLPAIQFAAATDMQENTLQSIASLHSDLVSDLHISRGSQRIDECAWITSMPELGDSYNFLVGRMLNHAARLLEVLLPYVGTSSSQGQQNALHCDVPTLLSLLTCYICLVRIYRYTFTSIAKSVPLLSTSTVKLPLLFPGLHLAGFSLEPHMDLQIQVLVQVAQTMLDEIDKAFGIPDKLDQQDLAGLIHKTGFPIHLVRAMLQAELAEEHKDGILAGDNEPLRDIFASLRRT